MSVQNHILKSLHSAWIDELNEKFPDEKLELGLPKRLPGWGTLESTQITRICSLEAQGVRGLGAWGFLDSQKSNEMKSLAEKTLKRGIEHIKIHHQIELTAGKIEEYDAQRFAVSCTIWFPITVQVAGKRLVFDLGVGF